MKPTALAETLMSEKRSKYDTDPLDPDFVRRTKEPLSGGATRDVGRTSNEAARRDAGAEEPTRRLADAPAPEERFHTSYPSVFVPPTYQPPAPQQQPRPHAAYGAPPAHGAQAPTQQPPVAKPTRRNIQKLGIPENFALVLPYAPFYIGLVAALVEMILVPRTETRVRFHAAQGLALQLVMVAGSFIFGLVGAITDSRIGGSLFWIASTIFLIASMVRVWEGKPHHIAPLDDLTQKINQKFEPKK